MSLSDHSLLIVLIFVGIICFIFVFEKIPINLTEFLIKIIPPFILIIIALAGLIYTSAAYHNNNSPFEPNANSGNWIIIGAAGMNNESHPMIGISYNFQNHGTKMGTITNIAIEVKVPLEKKEYKSYFFKSLREIKTIKLDDNKLIEKDVFRPITINAKSEVNKVYAFVFEEKIEKIKDSPELNIITWLEYNNDEWINAGNLTFIDTFNTWNNIKNPNSHIIETENSKESLEQLKKKDKIVFSH